MIGGISKIRPCGHRHVHKYNHAQTVNDVKTISWDYKGDGNSDKEWHFEMQNLTSGDQLLRGIYYAEKIDKEFPSLTTIRSFYGNSPSLVDVKLSFPNVVTASSGLADYAGTNPIERTMEIKLPKAKNLSGLFYENEIPYNGLNLYCPEATNINNIVEWGWTRNSYHALNAEFPKAEQATGFWWKAASEFLHDVDEDGNFSFATGKPTVGKAYTTFPSLKDAQNFGMNQKLSRDYTKAFLDDLPNWSGDTGNHRLRLGLSIDGKYDPEVQSKLYEADETYTSTINLSGGPTSHKNWKITVDWNGMSNGYAIPKEEIVVSNDYQLPQDYTKLIYLDSTGTASSGYGKAYINTGIVPTSQTGIYVEAMVANNNGYVFGCHNSNGNGMGIDLNNWSSNGLQDSPPCLFYGTRNYVTNTNNFPIHNIFSIMHMNYKNNKYVFLKMGDAQWHMELGEFNYDISSQIFLFGLCTGNGTLSEGLRGKIYRAQITEGEELIRDFVPCLDAEGVPCMRDLVNGVDYYNAGSGQFTYELA